MVDKKPVVARAFRHDPSGSILSLARAPSAAVEWATEPVVCGYRTFTYENRTLNRTFPVPISASPVLVDGVGVIVASDDGYVRLLNKDLTKIYWERRLDGSVYASLTADNRRSHVIVAATTGLVSCFDLRGRLVWHAKLDVGVWATPTVLPAADVLIIAGFHSRCFGLELGTGEVVFDRKLPSPWHTACGGSASHRDPYASPVTTADDTAIACCAEHVLCLAGDGTELWRQEVGHSIKASPVALHETNQVAACAVDGTCWFLDSGSGMLIGRVSLGAKIIASPAVSGTILAIGTEGGAVTALDIRTLERRWQASHGAPRSYTSFSVLPNGDFIATGERGNVICLRAADGRFRWETSQVLGLPEHDPAMDITPIAGKNGRMYCASYSGVLYQFMFRERAM